MRLVLADTAGAGPEGHPPPENLPDLFSSLSVGVSDTNHTVMVSVATQTGCSATAAAPNHNSF